MLAMPNSLASLFFLCFSPPTLPSNCLMHSLWLTAFAWLIACRHCNVVSGAWCVGLVYAQSYPCTCNAGSLMQLDYLLCPVNTCADKLAAARVMADQTLFKQLSAQCGSSDSSGWVSSAPASAVSCTDARARAASQYGAIFWCSMR